MNDCTLLPRRRSNSSLVPPQRSISPFSPVQNNRAPVDPFSLSLSLSLSPSFDFLDNPLIQHRPSCVTHRSGFFLVVGLNLLLIFDPLLILRVLSFNLFPKKPASRFFAYVSVFFFFWGRGGGGGGEGCFSLEFGLWRRFVVFMR
jgi:hypothetical protein